MGIVRRRFGGAGDVRRMHALALEYPNETLHVADLPYRLSSPALYDAPELDVALWEDEVGALVGFAFIQHGCLLDFATAPRAHDSGVESLILAWTVERYTAVARARAKRLPYWVSAREDDARRRALFAQAGFAPREWSTLHLRRPLDLPLERPELPDGFTVRPLHGDAEVGAYVACHQAAFGTENMTIEWRRRTLSAPAYRPELDLVIEAPEGRLAAFAVCWLNPRPQGQTGRREGQIEPAGTHPDFRRLGLARAILIEAFQRLELAGAEIALVETDSHRGPAQRLYESVGLVLHHRVTHFARTC